MDFGKIGLDRLSKNSRYSKDSKASNTAMARHTYKYTLYNKRASNDIDDLASPLSPATVKLASAIHPSSPGGEEGNTQTARRT